jgi:multiple sugar transport system permease protein
MTSGPGDIVGSAVLLRRKERMMSATRGVTARARRSTRRRQELLGGLGFIAPFMAIYVLFLLVPVVQAFYMSGFDWDLLSSTRSPVGFANYRRMLWGTGMEWSVEHALVVRTVIVFVTALAAYGTLKRTSSRVRAAVVVAGGLIVVGVLGIHPSSGGGWSDPAFWNSLKNTMVFTFVSTPILVVLGLALALAIHKRRGGALYRAAFFLPYVLPISAVTLIWSYLLNPDRGLIGGFLGWFGRAPIAFLSDPKLAMPAIIATTVWWSVGFNLVLFVAGLQDIDATLYEAASLDGAGYWRQFRHVTLPGLNHVTILVTVTQAIASFQIFGQVYIMTRGGPGKATDVLVQHIYEAGFRNYQLGYAAAMSVFLFVVMSAVSAVQFRMIARSA